jgi:hypothetical protein
MKIQVIGSEIMGEVLQGTVKVGSEIVIAHRGKVKRGVVVRTKKYNKFLVSYDKPVVMIKSESHRVKGPISKGMKEEYRALSSSQM